MGAQWKSNLLTGIAAAIVGSIITFMMPILWKSISAAQNPIVYYIDIKVPNIAYNDINESLKSLNETSALAKKLMFDKSLYLFSIRVTNNSDATIKNFVIKVPQLVYSVAETSQGELRSTEVQNNNDIVLKELDPGESFQAWALSDSYFSDYAFSPHITALADGIKADVHKAVSGDESGIVGAVYEHQGVISFLVLWFLLSFTLPPLVIAVIFRLRHNINFVESVTSANDLKRYQKIIDYVLAHNRPKAVAAGLKSPVAPVEGDSRTAS